MQFRFIEKCVFLSTFFVLLVIQSLMAQDVSNQIIELENIEVRSEKLQRIFSPNFSKKNVRVGVKGEAEIVSKIDLGKGKYGNLEGVEFFFNHKWSSSGVERFLIRPVIYSVVDGAPEELLFKSMNTYSIGNTINEKFFIDLSDFTIDMLQFDSLFLGFQLIKESGSDYKEDFNFVMNEVKTKSPVTFLKVSCSNCDFFPDVPIKNKGIALKYVAYFSK